MASEDQEREQIARKRKRKRALASWQKLVDRRAAMLTWVDQPLVLISQIQRSGGTLLSQLLDGHPQVHAHPHELHTGWPRPKEDWPVLDLSDEHGEWFRRLREKRVTKHFRDGYTKYSRGMNPDIPADPDEVLEAFPFLLVPELQEELFERCVQRRPIRAERDVFNCYMTSYFNAWLDNRNLYEPDKRWVAGFVPRLALSAENRQRFASVYPDGRLVFIVRDPVTWYSSASRHRPEEYGDPAAAADLWSWSTRQMIDARTSDPGSVVVLRFEDLVLRTDATMRSFARKLEIEYLPLLTIPTFNGMPIKADSSYPVLRHGILEEAVSRAPDEHPFPDAARAELDETYASVTKLALRP